MYLSSFDLEVHAQSIRERAMAEAASERRAAAACRGGRPRAARIWPALTPAAIRRWFTAAGLADDPRPAGVAPAVDFPAPRSTNDRERNPSRLPSRAAEPYGAMIVIARGQMVEHEVPQPSHVEEC